MTDIKDEGVIVPATTGTMRTMVDGTLKMFVEFQPDEARNAIEAFGTLPGTHVFVARKSEEG